MCVWGGVGGGAEGEREFYVWLPLAKLAATFLPHLCRQARVLALEFLLLLQVPFELGFLVVNALVEVAVWGEGGKGGAGAAWTLDG